MSGEIRIGYLVDHPEALPVLECLFQAEWAAYYGPTGPGNAIHDLVACSNRDRLPVGVVALFGSEPCGVAALKADSIATHTHLGPWIGGGMVAPPFRRRGIGARLVAALEAVAREFGYRTVYAGTSTSDSLLVRGGWQFIEVVAYDGQAVSIYEKAL